MSEKRPDTWMPLYWGDYLKDTMHLTAEGHGAYLLMIGAYWSRGGPLPDDDDFLRVAARLDTRGWNKWRKTLAALFEVGDGLWRHGRIDRELSKAETVAEVRRKAGRISAEKRWKIKGRVITHAVTEAQQNGTPSPSPSPIEERKKERVVGEGGSGGKQRPAAPAPAAASYAFVGNVIRLKSAELEQWRKAFPLYPSLESELTAIDAKLRDDPPPSGKWFGRVASWLRTGHDRLKAAEAGRPKPRVSDKGAHPISKEIWEDIRRQRAGG